MREKVKALWKLCFNDSEAFIDMYFRLRYTDEANISIQNDTEVISALQMIPYPMTFCGYTVQTSYISGACTHPDFRGKGTMRKLLSLSFQRMLHKNVLFSTLIPAEPWLTSYYSQMGYAPVFDYSTKEITIPQTVLSKDIIIKSVSDYQEEVYQYLNKRLSERSCYIQHTSDDFRVIMADLVISDGILLVARQQEKIKGLGIAYRSDHQLIINEVITDSKEIENHLLYHMKQYTGHEPIIQLLPPNEELPRQSLGMARIINVKEVLQLYASAFQDEEIQLEITDKQLPINNGYYRIQQGKCEFSTKPQSNVYTPMNVSELTSKILQPLRPYMSLMLN